MSDISNMLFHHHFHYPNLCTHLHFMPRTISRTPYLEYRLPLPLKRLAPRPSIFTSVHPVHFPRNCLPETL